MDLLNSLTDKSFPFLLFYSLLFSSSFVFAGVSNSNALSTQEQCIEDHFSALLHLKQSFNFSSWNPDNRNSKTRLPSWNSDNRDCCSWEGITCYGASGHVTSLDLSELDIYGRIDYVSLFRLQSLQKLNLAYNDFDGSTIPSGFEQLTSLTHLNLSSLHFYGQIPLEISRLTTLVSLDLSYNQYFNASYAEDLKLENLNIGAFVQNLSSLRELYLDDVKISAHGTEWGQALSSTLPRLRKLSLKGCHLSDPIHSSLSELRFLSSALVYLDLSNNDLSGPLPSWLVKLEKLMHLDLSNNGFSGPLPSSLANLSNLAHLHLSYNGFSGPLPSLLVKLDKLVSLDLSSNNFSGPIPSSYGNKFQNLQSLMLDSNSLSGTIPSLFSLPSLEQLELQDNQFSGQLDQFHYTSSSVLWMIDLSNNLLSGTIPSSLFSLPSLQTLDLRDNQFSGQLDQFQYTSSSMLSRIDLSNNSLSGTIPSSLFSLPSLQVLYLQDNQFSGQLDRFQYTPSSGLWSIDLSNNSLSGTIPSSLFSLPSLQVLALQDNQFSGQLGEFQNASSSQLGSIELSNNNLQGPIPRSIFALTKLDYLRLSSNNFSGDVDLGCLFQNLKYLRYLDLSNNQFSVGYSGSNSTSISFPKIRKLSLRSCNISKFPDILRSQEEMEYLDLSNNKVNGEIPNWIWKVGNGTLYYLNLSQNALEGLVPPSLDLSISTLRYLDLSFNKLEGSIPIPPLSIEFYSLSSNNFSGEVPLLFCNAQIKVLILFDNRFNGSIPPCLGENNIGLVILNLRGNAFQGILPKTFKEQCTLETLDLSQNRLEGQVPRSLANCKKLEVLNLGNNQINGTFPFQLENFSQLRVLILRSNKFHGTVGQFLTTRNSPLLQIIDLSSNSFTGSLPSNMFKSWKAMMEEGKSQSQFLSKRSNGAYYQDKVTIVSKGLEMEFVKILIAFTVVDLSNNKFYGDIPKSIGNLKSLHVLNISYNHLIGRIPASLGNIKELESLDLSQNNLSGKIPEQLIKLTFLAVLNLSQNLLVGSIPHAQQFLTFTNESFQGNSGLCGPPLSKKCGDNKVSLPSAQSESKYDWKSMCIGFGIGYSVGLGILLWTLALWTKGKREYIMFIDKMLLLIYPCEVFSLMHRY